MGSNPGPGEGLRFLTMADSPGWSVDIRLISAGALPIQTIIEQKFV
jgi:hypothetical protein